MEHPIFFTPLEEFAKENIRYQPTLLIIDEWLLFKLRENEARLLLEVIHKRRKKSSTIFCSQYEEKDWYNQICDGESTLADAHHGPDIVRLVQDKHRVHRQVG
nr:ATP-binding protein [Hallerella succinigenes]